MNKINCFAKSRIFATRSGFLVATLSALAFAAQLSGAPAATGGPQDVNTQIGEILQVQAAFHEAVSHNGDPANRILHLALMNDLWTVNSTLSVFGTVYTGREAIIAFWTAAPPFNNQWVSMAPTFRSAIVVHGNTADVYFECYFVNAANEVLVARSLSGSLDKVNGRWQFSNVVIDLPSTPIL